MASQKQIFIIFHVIYQLGLINLKGGSKHVSPFDLSITNSNMTFFIMKRS